LKEVKMIGKEELITLLQEVKEKADALRGYL